MKTWWAFALLISVTGVLTEKCDECNDVILELKRLVLKENQTIFDPITCSLGTKVGDCTDRHPDCLDEALELLIGRITLSCAIQSDQPQQTSPTGPVNAPCSPCIEVFNKNLQLIDYSDNRLARYQICSYGKQFSNCLQSNPQCADSSDSERMLKHATDNLKHLHCDKNKVVTPKPSPCAACERIVPFDVYSVDAMTVLKYGYCYESRVYVECMGNNPECLQGDGNQKLNKMRRIVSEARCDVDRTTPAPPVVTTAMTTNPPVTVSGCERCTKTFYDDSGAIDHNNRDQSKVLLCQAAVRFMDCTHGERNSCAEGPSANIYNYVKQVIDRYGCQSGPVVSTQPPTITPTPTSTEPPQLSNCMSCGREYSEKIRRNSDSCTSVMEYMSCIGGGHRCNEGEGSNIFTYSQQVIGHFKCGEVPAVTETPVNDQCTACVDYYKRHFAVLDSSNRVTTNKSMCSVLRQTMDCMERNRCRGREFNEVTSQARNYWSSIPCVQQPVATTKPPPPSNQQCSSCVQVFYDENNSIRTTGADQQTICGIVSRFLDCMDRVSDCREGQGSSALKYAKQVQSHYRCQDTVVPVPVNNYESCEACYRYYNQSVASVSNDDRRSFEKQMCRIMQIYTNCVSDKPICSDHGLTTKTLDEITTAGQKYSCYSPVVDPTATPTVTPAVVPGTKTCSKCIREFYQRTNEIRTSTNDKKSMCNVIEGFYGCLQQSTPCVESERDGATGFARRIDEMFQCSGSKTAEDSQCMACYKNYEMAVSSINSTRVEATALQELCDETVQLERCFEMKECLRQSSSSSQLMDAVRKNADSLGCGSSGGDGNEKNVTNLQNCLQCILKVNEVMPTIDFRVEDDIHKFCPVIEAFEGCINKHKACKDDENVKRTHEILMQPQIKAFCSKDRQQMNATSCMGCLINYKDATSKLDLSDLGAARPKFCLAFQQFDACIRKNAECGEEVYNMVRKSAEAMQCFSTTVEPEEEETCSECFQVYYDAVNTVDRRNEAASARLCSIFDAVEECVTSNPNCNGNEESLSLLNNIRQTEAITRCYSTEATTKKPDDSCVECFQMYQQIFGTMDFSNMTSTCSGIAAVEHCFSVNEACHYDQRVASTLKNIRMTSDRIGCGGSGGGHTQNASEPSFPCMDCLQAYNDAFNKVDFRDETNARMQACDIIWSLESCMERNPSCQDAEGAQDLLQGARGTKQQLKCDEGNAENVTEIQVSCMQCIKMVQNLDPSDTEALCERVNQFISCTNEARDCDVERHSDIFEMVASMMSKCSDGGTTSIEGCDRCLADFSRKMKDVNLSDPKLASQKTCQLMDEVFSCADGSEPSCSAESLNMVAQIRQNYVVLRCGANETVEPVETTTSEPELKDCSDCFGQYKDKIDLSANYLGLDIESWPCDQMSTVHECMQVTASCNDYDYSFFFTDLENEMIFNDCEISSTIPEIFSTDVGQPDCTSCNDHLTDLQSAVNDRTEITKVCNLMNELQDCMAKMPSCRVHMSKQISANRRILAAVRSCPRRR